MAEAFAAGCFLQDFADALPVAAFPGGFFERGEDLGMVEEVVYDLDDEAEFAAFAKGSAREIKVYGSDRTVTYDPQKRIGVMISKIGASKPISVGAYDFALAQLDA